VQCRRMQSISVVERRFRGVSAPGPTPHPLQLSTPILAVPMLAGRSLIPSLPDRSTTPTKRSPMRGSNCSKRPACICRGLIWTKPIQPRPDTTSGSLPSEERMLSIISGRIFWRSKEFWN